MASKTIKLKSSDEDVIEVDIEVAKYSKVIKTMIEDCQIKVGESDVIPLPKVSSPILEKILKWAEHQKNCPQQENNNNATIINISSWEEEFLKVDPATLVALVAAADYLDIERLLDISCYTVGKVMEDNSAEKLREIFNIENDSEPDSD